jgi:HK97 family phage major capsid protein
MNKHAIHARAESIYKELSQPNVSAKRVDELSAEMDRLDVQSRNLQKANSMASYGSPNEWNGTPNPGGFSGSGDYDSGAGVQWKSFGLPSAPQVAPPSMDVSAEQVKSLFDAAKAGAPYKVQLGTKDFASSFRDKTAGAPLTESGLNNQLPAIQVPGNMGQYGKPYEPFRLLANIPTVAMTGPSAAYLQHTTNTNEAARVAEGAAKPSLGPTVTETFIKPMKIAGTVEATLEILQDHEQFASWLPTELQRSVINAESLYLFQANASGGPTAAEFSGLLATSGTLSQDATGLVPADAISLACVLIRIGSAFSEPDLVVMSPKTAAAILRTKSTTGSYIFDVVRGPGGLNQLNEFDIFGVRTVTSTQVPDGTAIVMSIQGGAAVGWIRMGLELMYNPYGGTTDAGADLWRTNQYSWRCEERVSLSVPRPAAICIVTNLPTS